MVPFFFIHEKLYIIESENKIGRSFMEKFFNALSKPAKWIFIIGGLFYATWFIIENALSIDGQFVSVIRGLVVLSIGAILIAGAPILVICRKDEAAKMVFLFLLGYWVLNSAQAFLGNAEAFTDSNEGLAITSGIFALIAGLGLAAIIVLVALEFVFKFKTLRFIAFLVMLGVIVFGFLAALLVAIYAGTRNVFWPNGVQLLIEWMILPVVVLFGYIYFLGAPKKNK